MNPFAYFSWQIPIPISINVGEGLSTFQPSAEQIRDIISTVRAAGPPAGLPPEIFERVVSSMPSHLISQMFQGAQSEQRAATRIRAQQDTLHAIFSSVFATMFAQPAKIKATSKSVIDALPAITLTSDDGDAHYDELSVKELKARLAMMGKSIDTFVEKAELVAALESTWFSTTESLNTLKVKELKRRLIELGINPDSFLERDEMERTLVAALQNNVLKSTSSRRPCRRATTTECFGSDATESCTICLGDFRPGDMITKLPCGHSFHLGLATSTTAVSARGDECCAGILTWLTANSFCPNCKSQLPKQDDQSEASAGFTEPSGVSQPAPSAESTPVHWSSSSAVAPESESDRILRSAGAVDTVGIQLDDPGDREQGGQLPKRPRHS